MTPQFTLNHLQVSHKANVLLAAEHLELPANAITAIIGANGAGKSTLIHALLGQVSGCEVKGEVRCLGRSVSELVRAGHIAWVGQHERFEAPLSVQSYALLGTMPTLAWYQQPSREAVIIAQRYLAEFDLLALAKQRIQTLSGGERQRLAMVRAMMQDTDILLLDEPTNHLDIKHQRKLFSYLKLLVQERQKSIIMVLHSLTDAYNHADHVIALAHGQVLAQGNPKAVMTPDILSQMYGVSIHAHHTDNGVVFF